MTSNDLRNLLRTTAADGSDTVDLAEDELADRIRQRRTRTSRFAVAGTALATAAVVTAAAWAVRPDGEHPPIAGTPTTAAAPVPFPHKCGTRLTGQHPVESPLRVTIARQDVEVVRPRDYGRVTAVMTNTSDELLEGVTASAVRLVVVKDGIVVGTTGAMTANALRLTLPPRGSKTLFAGLPLRRCNPTTSGIPNGRSGPPLEPGSYQLYTEYDVSVSSPSDPTPPPLGGDWKVLRSGPWTVDLR